VLDAPAEVLAARKSEHPVAELADMRERYRALATREGAVVVDTTQPVENVADEIARAAWRRLTEGWRRG
jgi:thymidylate kinase